MIIIVDRYSTDRTAEIAKEKGMRTLMREEGKEAIKSIERGT